MKRVAFLAAVLVLVLAAPAIAQDDGEFCAVPEGCDLDGDGVAETPAGEPVPAQGQYGPEEEFCAIPEGCDASASPDPSDESSVPPVTPANSAPAPAEEGGASSGPTSPSAASSPAEGGSAGAGSTETSPPADESADGGSGGESAGASAASTGENPPVAGLTVLPETGGVPAAPLGVGVLLVAGGLLVRRAFH